MLLTFLPLCEISQQTQTCLLTTNSCKNSSVCSEPMNHITSSRYVIILLSDITKRLIYVVSPHNLMDYWTYRMLFTILNKSMADPKTEQDGGLWRSYFSWPIFTGTVKHGLPCPPIPTGSATTGYCV